MELTIYQNIYKHNCFATRKIDKHKRINDKIIMLIMLMTFRVIQQRPHKKEQYIFCIVFC